MLLFGIDTPVNGGTATTIIRDKIEFYDPFVQTSTELYQQSKKLSETQKLNPIINSTIGISGEDITLNNDAITTLHESALSFNDYDLTVKLPVRKTFKMKMKIKSISKFTPKISLD